MTAQEKILEYAKSHNDEATYTHQQWIGKAMTEGIVIDRTSNSMTICNVRREGTTIIVTETVRTRKIDAYNPDPKNDIITEEVAEVMRVEL